MRTRTLVGLLSCMCLVLCLYVAPAANAATAEEEVLQVIINFAKATTNNDQALMSSLWWNSPKTSTFGPPKGLAFLTEGYEPIMMWFKDMNKYPAGTFVRTVQNPQVMILGDNVAVVTAYSVITQNPPVVKEQTYYQERMTFVVQKIGGKWLIVHGHGSAFPAE